MKSWAKGDTAEIPDWVITLQFAKEFHIEPHRVDDIPAIWIQRWSILSKVEAAQAARQKLLSDVDITNDDTELIWWLGHE